MLIRRASVDDADAYADCQLSSMRAAYAHFMPEAFFDRLAEERPERIERFRQAIGNEVDSGDRADTQHWVAEQANQIIGICTVTDSPRPWEEDLDVPPPPIQRQLAQLYVMPTALNQGVGQTLLDLALPTGQGAYLWVMADNPRAERFYHRNHFVDEGVITATNESWYHHLMKRMWRPDPIKN